MCNGRSSEDPLEPDAAEKLAALVPSAYYDLIARVVPGLVTLAAMSAAEPGYASRMINASGLSGAALVVAVGIASYAVGLLLTPFGSLLCEVPVLAIAKMLPPLARASSKQLWADIAIIERARPAASITLAKMAAEVALCQNLMAGLIPVWWVWRDRWSSAEACVAIFVCAANVIFRTFVLFRRVGELGGTPHLRHEHE